MASITANVTFVRWSVKWKLSCLVRGRLRDYKNQSTSAPSRSLKKYFKKFSNRQEWVLGRREGGFTCTPFHIPSLNTKQTNYGRVWCDIAIGVSSWTEVNYIRMSSSSKMFCSNFILEQHWNNCRSKQGESYKLRVSHRRKSFRTNNSV